jgi:hypothetical protein
LDFQRAVLAFQYAEPLVAFNEMNVGLHPLGHEGDLFVLQRFLDPHGLGNLINAFPSDKRELANQFAAGKLGQIWR